MTKGDNCQWHAEYAEPGYSTMPAGIVTGNYNDCPHFAAALEALGVECEWEDEWCSCSDCGGLVRTEPDCMSWEPAYVVGDGELLCTECHGKYEEEEPEDEPEPAREPCPSCEVLYIQGVRCHETGCPVERTERLAAERDEPENDD